ncbi:MAG: S-layer homology domain-containing protein [Clostridia bacterium]|nr:S-layer homology domain-containing protein [Clostridia bacterium]
MCGRDEDDTSFHISDLYKLPYGTFPNKQWFATNYIINLNKDIDKNIWRIHFSTTQNMFQEKWKPDGEGAGLKLYVVFKAGGATSEKCVLDWQSSKKQGMFSGYYFDFMPIAGKWLNYDYVIHKNTGKLDVYINGYKVIEGAALGIKNLSGIKQLKFNAVDVDTSDGAEQRFVESWLDDFRITACDTEPRITPAESLGDRAVIDAPELEKYVSNDFGVIYNYGQSLSWMKEYLDYETIEMWAEEAGSTVTWPIVSRYDSDSLAAVSLNDGRKVSPRVRIIDDYAPFEFAVKQPVSTRIEAVVDDIQPGAIKIKWRNASEDFDYVEVFRNDIFVGRAANTDDGFTDESPEQGVEYEYTLREVRENGDATYFSEAVSTFISSIGRPENFDARSAVNSINVELSWEAPSYGEVTGYEIYRDGKLIDTVDADTTEYTDEKNLVEGTVYSYSIAAISEGDRSARTEEVEALAAIILAPQDIGISSSSDGKISLSWTEVPDAAAYEVYRNNAIAGTTTECGYVFEDCEPDTLYEFYVKSQNADGYFSAKSESKRYIFYNPMLKKAYTLFDDSFGTGITVAATGNAETEAGADYACVGSRGMKMTFNSKEADGQTVIFKKSDGYDLSALKNSDAEIRFLLYLPENTDVKNLSFGAVQSFKSASAGGPVTLTAAVGMEKYVSGTGWQLVRIPIKDLPDMGSYKAAYMPYEHEFDYEKTEGLGIVSNMTGIIDSETLMIDEAVILASNAPEVKYVSAGGEEVTDGKVISGRTREFRIGFSQKMKAESIVNKTAAVVRDGARIPSVTEYDEESDEYIIKLLENLEANQEYSLTAENTVSDSGIKQNTVFSVSFTTNGDVSTDEPAYTTDIKLVSGSYSVGTPVKQELRLESGMANEQICGFDIKIGYDKGALRVSADDITLASALKKIGAEAETADGGLRIYCKEDKSRPLNLGDGIAEVLFEVLQAKTSDISATGTVSCYYADRDVIKAVNVSGRAEIKGSSSVNHKGSSGGGSSSGGSRPSAAAETVIKPPASGTSEQTSFADVSKTPWAKEAIEYLSKAGIISGYPDNTFRPDEPITREEFAAVAVRAFNLPNEGAKAEFSDVSSGDWYYTYIAACAGIFNGYDDGRFGVGVNISRQDMCTILSRIMQSMGLELEEKYSKLEFTDSGDIAEYAAPAVTMLQQAGIINGMGGNAFMPEGQVTRAMAAKAVYEIVSKTGTVKIQPSKEQAGNVSNAAPYNAADNAGRLTALGFMEREDLNRTDKKMSRELFVKTAVRLYVNADNLPDFNNFTFADVQSGSFAAKEIQFAADAGLIEKNEYFYPSEPITYTEAAEIMVKVLGYEPAAKQSDYMSATSQAKLLKNVSAVFDMKDALKMLDNALECPIMQAVYYGESVAYEVTDKESLLTKAGYTKNRVTLENADAGKGLIIADGKLYETENIDLGKIAEGRVNIYIRKSDDTVVYIEVTGDTRVLYDFIEYVNGDNGRGELYPNAVSKVTLRNDGSTYSVSDDAKVLFSDGAGAGSYTGCFAKVILNENKIVKLEAYPLRSGGLIYRADADKLKYITAKYAENVISGFSDLDSTEIYIDGVRYEQLSSLKADMVFDYWNNPEEDKFIIVASSRIAEGLLESCSPEELVIDGVGYELNSERPAAVQSYLSKKYTDEEQVSSLLGKQVAAYVDDNKCIRFIRMNEALSSISEFYGVITKAFSDGDEDDRNLEIYLLTGKKGLGEYKVSDKLLKDSLSFEYAKSVARDYSGRGFLKFTLNGNGEIKKIEEPEYWGFTRTAAGFAEEIDGISGLSFRKAAMFALLEIDGRFTVKPITWENIKKTRTINNVRVTMVSDFDIEHNPIPRFIAFTDNIQYLYSQNTAIGILQEVSYLTDDKIRLTFADGSRYIVTKEFAEANRLTGRSLVRFSDRMLGDNPISVHSVYDMSGEPDTWQVTEYSQDLNAGFFTMDSVRLKDVNVIQFEKGGVPSEVYFLDQWCVVYEYNPATGKCIYSSLANLSEGDKVWYYVAEWPSPKSVQTIVFIKDGMTPSDNQEAEA